MGKSYWLGGALAGLLATAGCGNTYRPVVSAINPIGPAGQPQKYAVVISDPRTATDPTASGLVTLVDFSGDTVLVTPNVGINPYYLIVNQGGNTGYTLNGDGTVNSFDISPSLRTINVEQTTLLTDNCPASATNCDAYRPNSIFPTNGSTYITQPGRSAVAELQGAPPKLQQELPVAANPVFIAGIGGGPRAYAISQGGSPSGNGQVAAIETAGNTISTTLPVGRTPVYGVMTADGKRAFVMNQGDNTISVINSQTNQLDTPTSTIKVGASPVWADFAPTLSELIVANAGGGTSPGSLSIISIPLCSAVALSTNPNCDPTNPVDAVGFGTVLATVPVGVNPLVVSVLQDGTRAYVVNQGDSTVSVVNLTTNKVSAVIPVPASPHPTFLAATTGAPTGKVYVTSPESNYMTVIRTDTDTIEALVPLQGKGIQVRVTAP